MASLGYIDDVVPKAVVEYAYSIITKVYLSFLGILPFPFFLCHLGGIEFGIPSGYL